MKDDAANASPNRQILDRLFAAGEIDLERGRLFDRPPGPLPRDLDWGRVEGMMLGLAIGDALGNTTESQLPHQRKKTHGEIRDYLPNRHVSQQRIGFPSDDTQLAFWTLEQMMEDRGFNPEHVAARFTRSWIYGIGGTVKEFISNYQSGIPWYRCGPKSAGNGALMRMAPLVIPHLETGSSDLWVDTALSAMITHNDAGSTAACLAFVNLLWQLLAMNTPPRPEWWLESYVQVARELEGSDRQYRPRTSALPTSEGPIWTFVAEKVSQAYARGLTVLEAGNRWYSGAYLLETMPSVIYILMRYGHDPEEAIVRAVNDTKDNDTIAAIVGAAVGALHGKARLPDRWIHNLAGRTAKDDDGRVFALLAEARRIRWNPSASPA